VTIRDLYRFSQWYNTNVLVLISLVYSTVAIVFLACRTIRALQSHAISRLSLIRSTNLPTVSVCIAARNETQVLAQCLERIVRSDYAKLEILVLDDSSTDDTSLIIKSFANAGVRFIPGKSLPNGWLGKNHAYKTLADEASGDLILFMDVDTVISPSTVSQLVALQTGSGKSMLSVLPRREDTARISAVFGTMRYYWELLLGTRDYPPVSSALWMIDADTLRASDFSWTSYGMSVRPERHIARKLPSNNYYYLIGTKNLGVAYEKKLRSQFDTAIRLYYPATNRRVVTWIVSSTVLAALLVPVLAGVAFVNNLGVVAWSFVLAVIMAATFGIFTHVTYGGKAKAIRIVIGPLLITQELALLAMSYIRYLTGTVTWKGRSVTAQNSNPESLHLSE
jgi:glycosyltransferase involved in cell wall biosynthesis